MHPLKKAPNLLHIAPTAVQTDNRELTYFGGSDYLRLSWHPKIRKAFTEAAQEFGHNLSASRVTTGNHFLYGELESGLAKFACVPGAVLTPSGYCAPLALGQALAGRATHVFLGTRAHGCLKDAARLSGALVRTFPHEDTEALRKLIRKLKPGARPIIMTDGLSAHEGTVAPIAEYLDALPDEGWLMVDDAHGFGTLGQNGRGTLELLGVRDPRVLLTVTLSKTVGSFGGAVLGPHWLKEEIVNAGRLYSGGSPVGLPYVSAALASLDLLRSEGHVLRTKLGENTAFVRQAFAVNHPDWLQRPGPTISIVPESVKHQQHLRKRLLKAGVYPSLIRYHGGPSEQFFRFAVSSAHSEEELKRLRDALME